MTTQLSEKHWITTLLFFQQPWYKKGITLGKFVGHAFFKSPLVNALVSWFLILTLLYLETSWLAFTPVNSILLATTLLLSVFATSLLNRINFLEMIRTSEHKEDDSEFTYTFSALCNKGLQSRTGINFFLTACLYGSATFFMAATLNKLLYTLFITSSAISLLPFATTPWACFMFFTVCAAITYGINHAFIKENWRNNSASQATTSQGRSTTVDINGVTFPNLSFVQVVGRAITISVRTTTMLIGRAAQDSLGILKADPEVRRAIGHSIGIAINNSSGILKATTSARDAITSASIMGSTAIIQTDQSLALGKGHDSSSKTADPFVVGAP